MLTVEETNFMLAIVAVLLFIGAKKIPELMAAHAEEKKKLNNDRSIIKHNTNLF